jgi:hypothetical protein
MSAFSNLIRNIAPKVAPVASLIPYPSAKVVGAAAGIVAQDTQKRQQKQIQEQQREQIMAMYPTGFDPVTGTVGTANSGNIQAGSGGFVSGITDFFRGAGSVVREAFGSGIPQLLGYDRPRGVSQQPAITSVTNVGAQESQGSGSIQAGLGTLIGPLAQAGRQLVKSPAGQIGIGTAIGGALGLLDSSGRQIRITRKTKRLAQQAYQLSMGDLSAATSLFAQLTGISVNEMQFVMILTKRFRNDGPVITKAAVRKTRSTLRKMKNMCDMYNSVAKTPTRRRASPMKRATTTLIKN